MKAQHIITGIAIGSITLGFAGLIAYAIQDAIHGSKFETIEVGEVVVSVEIADEPDEIVQGLSGRDGLETNAGMLFDLRDRREVSYVPSFWMKDMLFDLDMIWIDEEEIVYIHENVPAPKGDQNSLPTYSPDKKVEYVLEMEGGWSKLHDIEVGDKVKI